MYKDPVKRNEANWPVKKSIRTVKARAAELDEQEQRENPDEN